jgi:hypothetical protein
MEGATVHVLTKCWGSAAPQRDVAHEFMRIALYIVIVVTCSGISEHAQSTDQSRSLAYVYQVGRALETNLRASM